MKKKIKLIIIIIMAILSIICFKYVYDMAIVPNKYLYLLFLILFIINILSALLLSIKNIITNIIGTIIYIFIAIISILGIKYSNITINYLNEAFNNNKEYIKYNIIVLKDSNYTKIEDLNNTTMGYLFVDISDNRYLDTINKEIDIKLEQTDFNGIYEGLINKEIDSAVLNDAYLDMFEEEYSDFNEKIKTIYTFNIEIDNEKKDEKIEELKPINIYISGSDSREEYISTNSRSDVNIIMTINPNTHKVLLTNIPRDYYVKLHGTTGLNDKLTHAGIYGIDMSKKTIEDLFNIEIDYTIKVGFGSVVKLVDLVGGVDIYSDTAFYSHCSDGGSESVNVVVGMNHFTGAQALSYARERYAYVDGDNHRGRNQQQIIEAIFNKIISNKSILLKYDSLLTSFSELYRTDIPKDLITMLIKDQLDNMNTWTFISEQVTGTSSYGQTYSMPGRDLYVMIPDYASIEKAKNKMNEVIEEKVNENKEDTQE